MRLTISLIALLAAGAASAQTLTAGELQKMCAATAQNLAVACASYIQGYVNGRNQSLPRPSICVPPTTSIGSAVAGYVEYVEKNRLEANIEAGLVLGNYLLSTYPCR